MTIPEILEQLKPYTGKFPMAAMKAAIEQREAITPKLLRELEVIAAQSEEYAARKDYMLHRFAVYLLAQFGERRAFKPLVKLVSLPEELPFDFFGNTITERLSGLLGTLYDGDRTALQGLVESEQVNEYVRTAALDSFIVLERSGQMPREEVVGYFRELFHGRLKREHSHAWNGLVCSCADLPAPELLAEVRQAFQDELADPGFAGLAELERDLLADPELIKKNQGHQYSLVTDAINEMEWWAAFHPEPNSSRPRRTNQQASISNPSISFRREPKIGRNDPCPCGSGKKYKKCCLAKT